MAYVISLQGSSEADRDSMGAAAWESVVIARRLAEQGLPSPVGFDVTAAAFRHFLAESPHRTEILREIAALQQDRAALGAALARIRGLIRDSALPASLAQALALAREESVASSGPWAFMVRPRLGLADGSAKTDPPPGRVVGGAAGEKAFLEVCTEGFAAFFDEPAAAYWREGGCDPDQALVSLEVRRRRPPTSETVFGLMSSIDDAHGFPDAVRIQARREGPLGTEWDSEGSEEYRIFKPLLNNPGLRPVIGKEMARAGRESTPPASGSVSLIQSSPPPQAQEEILGDDAAVELARLARRAEQAVGRPLRLEWARMGSDGGFEIIDVRPEPLEELAAAGPPRIRRLKTRQRPLLRGQSAGQAYAAGPVCKLESPQEADRLEEGAVLVTQTVEDIGWLPVLERAAAVITENGADTLHGALLCRELGLPLLTGARHAADKLQQGRQVTVVGYGEGEGLVYPGTAEFETCEADFDRAPETRTRLMLSVADPATALRWWRLPCDGIGLARMEFIISHLIKVHPMALVHPEQVAVDMTRDRIEAITAPWKDKQRYFVDRLAHGLGAIAASQYPKPALVRMSDLKSNEYSRLLGGAGFEPVESNPMLGWRGASRYYSEDYRPGFDLECRAIRKARGEIGLDNIAVMIPFCRTPQEADRVLSTMAENGLERGRDGLRVLMMAETPVNIALAGEFAKRFDGFSIGTNDLTQLVLGVDRDSDRLIDLYDDRHEVVRQGIAALIDSAHRHGQKVGLCGQAAADDRDFARFLVEAGIDSLTVPVNSFFMLKDYVAEAEGRQPSGVDSGFPCAPMPPPGSSCGPSEPSEPS